MRTIRLIISAAAVASLLAGGLAATADGSPAPAAAPTRAAALATASTVSENSKLNRTSTPKLAWSTCGYRRQCATVSLPLDYDNPSGTKVRIAMVRRLASGSKIGTLFVNPGGPGGSATAMAYDSPSYLSSDILRRFDVIGVDPRGVGGSTRIKCMTAAAQARVLPTLSSAFPYGYAQETAYIQAARAVGQACSKTTMAKAASTAEVARDMEMVRRALGGPKLNFLGFSYGSQLGTTYANMFPANFRSIVIDGTINPQAWSGTASNQSKPLDARLGSGRGAWKAMSTILSACTTAGPRACSFARTGDPRTQFTSMTTRLKKTPLVVPDGAGTVTITYPDLIGMITTRLYSSNAPREVDELLTAVADLGPAQQGTARRSRTSATDSARLLASVYRESKDARPGRGYSYDLDAFSAVTCTDSRESTKLASYRTYAKQADASAPHFGRFWLWGSSQCAGDSFTGQDEDAYTGPYNRTTGKGVLVVGNYWDPATAYTGAQETRKILSRARLVSSDSWGHTAYRVSRCATTQVDRYLLTGRSPAADVTCPAERPVFVATAAKNVPDVLASTRSR